MSNQPMKIKKAKAGAPLWVPQVNEMCEYRDMDGNWVRCRIASISSADYVIEFENNGGLAQGWVNKELAYGCLREGTAPASKKDQIVRLLKTGQNDKALAMAAKFQDLGAHRDAITKGNNAARNPDFYRQIKQDPAALVAAGVAALRERYLEA